MDYINPLYAEMENDWSDDFHAEEEEEHEHEHEHDHAHDGHSHDADEHIWTSVKNVKLMVNAILEAFIEKDAANAASYSANAQKYSAELDLLDREFSEIFENYSQKPLLFADRFPFVYLMHDYHVPYSAAFSGCSTEVNAGFETQIDLIKTVQELNLNFIVTIDGGDKSLAEAISNETKCNIITLDSMQSVGKRDIENGASYIEIMKHNISALQKIINGGK